MLYDYVEPQTLLAKSGAKKYLIFHVIGIEQKPF